MMNYKALKDIANITMGQSPDSSSYNESGEGLPFFQGNADFGEVHPTERVWCREPKKIAKENDILISVRAPIGAINYAKTESCIGRGLAAITVDDPIERNYIYHLLKAKHDELNRRGTGSTFKAIGKSVLEEIQVPMIANDEKMYAMQIMDSAERIIKNRKAELMHLDELIKARFVEMFGDPVHNSFELPTLPMTEVCEIIDGDRGKYYPKQDEFYEDEYCLFLNAKNVTSHGFDFKECMFITKDKDKVLRKGKLERGDVVLTTRGTLGNLAFYTDAIPYENVRINSGMVILRLNRGLIDEGFFIEQFRMQVDDIKKTIASGSAQPQLPVSTMNKIKVIMPDLSRQKEFAHIVEQVDKSKIAIQKSLGTIQVLFDSLMQQYFG